MIVCDNRHHVTYAVDKNLFSHKSGSLSLARDSHGENVCNKGQIN